MAKRAGGDKVKVDTRAAVRAVLDAAAAERASRVTTPPQASDTQPTPKS